MPRSSPARLIRKAKRKAVHPLHLETLENRQLLSTINIATFGATPNGGTDDTAAIRSALRQSAPGDVISVPAGRYDLTSMITMPTGRTLSGTKGSELNFSVGMRDFAIAIESGASNVTITGLEIKANCGIILMNRGNYSNINIINNGFQWGYKGTYYNRLAIRATTSTNGLKIEHNNFHDSEFSDRNVDLWGISNASYSYNTFYLVNDGGHIMNPGDNVRYSFNVGRLIHRMGIEIQQTDYPPAHITQNFTIEGNIFYDWNKPYWDSMGLSVPLAGNGTRIINNYIRQNAFNNVWGEADSSGHVRGSYGIEAPQGTMLVAGNIVGGQRNVLHVATPGRDTPVRNNHFYGPASWGAAIKGEPGATGFGTFISENNTWDQDFSKMPEPPSEIVPSGDGGPVGGGGIGGGGGGGTPGGNGDLPPQGIATLLQAFVKDSSHITLSWFDTYTDEDGYKVERSLDGATWKTVFDSRAADVKLFADGGLPAGTVIFYRVFAYKGTAVSQSSNIVQARTKGVPGGSGTGGGGTGGGGFGARGLAYNPYTSTPTSPVLEPINKPITGDLFSNELI